MDWIEKLKGINPDVLHELVDTVSGGESEGGDIGDIVGSLVKNNPEMVQNFLQGIQSKNNQRITLYMKDRFNNGKVSLWRKPK